MRNGQSVMRPKKDDVNLHPLAIMMGTIDYDDDDVKFARSCQLITSYRMPR